MGARPHRGVGASLGRPVGLCRLMSSGSLVGLGAFRRVGASLGRPMSSGSLTRLRGFMRPCSLTRFGPLRSAASRGGRLMCVRSFRRAGRRWLMRAGGPRGVGAAAATARAVAQDKLAAP